MLLPLGALELSDKVQTYGAYAGFASVLGLAVLSLLYFGQARELRRLREWAGRAPERAAELQERVQAEAEAAAEASRRAAAPPAARPAAATSAAQQAAAAAKPGASPAAPAVPAVPAANPGAPGALSVPPSTAAGATAATAAGTTPGGAATGGAPSASPVDRPATDGSGVPGSPAAPADGAPAPTSPGQPTVVQGGLGPAGAAAAPKPSSPPPTGGGTGELVLPHPHPPASTQDSGETAVPLRRVSAGATLPPRPAGGGAGGTPSGGDGGDDGRRGPFAIVAGIVAVLIVGAIVGTQLLGGDDEPTAPNAITTAVVADGSAPQDRPRETTNTTKEPEVARGNVSVAVLNGTTVTGLARGAANKIEAAGYKIAKVGDNSVQTIQASSVQFTDGSRRAAEDVAKIAGVPTSSLVPMDAGTRVVAGEEAVVVVIVGADQSQ